MVPRSSTYTITHMARYILHSCHDIMLAMLVMLGMHVMLAMLAMLVTLAMLVMLIMTIMLYKSISFPHVTTSFLANSF